ncbi:MAG TPA: inosine monophosphate cyclohydrolase [Papillibacter sp.]|nr:inosine monophosphate cyclohydrolase [Papillibacter sp.]
MKAMTIAEQLGGNPYPGRGILLGRDEGGAGAVLVYFIMGRSENSRNRVFVATEDGIRTEAHDPSKMTDPRLIIYHPVRIFGDTIIVTNGDQTDTIRDHLQNGGDFRSALLTRTFEPDGPIYTPRISGLLRPDGSYNLSILKTLGGDPACCCRQFFEYDAALPGVGHLIHTYKGDGDPVPSFEGEPVAVNVKGSLEEFAQNVWQALDKDNRVSLFALRKDLETGTVETRIINKFTSGEVMS